MGREEIGTEKDKGFVAGVVDAQHPVLVAGDVRVAGQLSAVVLILDEEMGGYCVEVPALPAVYLLRTVMPCDGKLRSKL
jgi:hypothetical protein